MDVEAYCGPPPGPGDLGAAWNADPIALALIAALAMAHSLRRSGQGSRPALVAALVLIATLFLSPLCALTTALFSARVAHHAILVALVAPALALAFPRPPRLSVATLAGIHAVVLWLWHVPAVYQEAIGPAPLYWLMQLSLLASAVALWQAALDDRRALAPRLLMLGATVAQMGMLGALLTFAGRALYAPHWDTTLPYGLGPVADQQLAGLIMWVPAALPYLVGATVLISRTLAPAPVGGTR
ncbi:cytochrome c oxidase assembly protein [Zavarzinia sp. CC-PAN008]|uniref:cytochrome c oxidase assembly protein n=1 Tax=Zavarzinia sp. CC-PAN008 TaxID=3243332 RepID=UPI003F74AB74